MFLSTVQGGSAPLTKVSLEGQFQTCPSRYTDGVYVPEIEVPGGPYGRDELAAREKEHGWFAVDDRLNFILE